MPIPAHWQQTADDDLVYDVDGMSQEDVCPTLPPPIPLPRARRTYALPQATLTDIGGAMLVHTLYTADGTFTCDTPAPATRCRCGYYALVWPSLKEPVNAH